jgi:N-methylhydantoinase B
VIHCIFVQGCRHALQGFAGGGSGAGNYCVLDYGGPNEQKVTELAFLYPSQPGEVIFFQSGGGGAWGSPLERDPRKVLDDLVNELLSVEAARRDYGVVIDPDRRVVLEDETNALREELRRGEGEHAA